ncbi:hypothetical protein C7M84_004092 [Penaeus vannamei]|uniref:Uncharacterized protein n=1 Tax=Penaeus vannamei TaxID=6689 RepID=A0A3R7MIA2_PENVA|nr:uncharacterized protein LOC113804595 isoform X1 [Penaeus vannamei]ROT77272.1 hypothetical protein C7M84_004092 [Penaeus vannamei]
MAGLVFIFWFSFCALKTVTQGSPPSGKGVCEDWKLPYMNETQKYVHVKGSNPVYLWFYTQEAQATAELRVCCIGEEWKYKNITFEEANTYYLGVLDTESGQLALKGDIIPTIPRVSGIWLNSTSISYLICSVNDTLPENPIGRELATKTEKRLEKRAEKWMITTFVLAVLALALLSFSLACGILWLRKDAPGAVPKPERPGRPQTPERAHIYDEWNPNWSEAEEGHDSENSAYGQCN